MLKGSSGAGKKGGNGASPHEQASPQPSPNRVSLVDLTALTPNTTTNAEFLHSGGDYPSLRSSGFLVVDVWRENVREVFEKLSWLVEEFPYVAMDTEFPGIVARPLTTATGKDLKAYHYQTIKLNVDLLKLIQLGLCFCNAEGEVSRGLPGMYPPTPTATSAASTSQALASSQGGGIVYNFHFAFSLADDMFAQDSIDLLAQAGVDFAKHATNGIDPTDFAELLMTSGVVLNDDVRWLTFHSGFDFAYLLHLLLGGGGQSQSPGPDGVSPPAPTLPANEADFFELVAIYFPAIYDVKALLQSLPPNAPASTNAGAVAHGLPASLKAADLQRGGLSKLASTLQLGRIGPAHQAGSDALLTAAVFFRVRDLFFRHILPPTVAQLQHAAAAASAQVLSAISADKEAAKEKDRERDAYAAATDSTAAMLNAFAQQEEKYLGTLYGLQPTANAILRGTREKERAQTIFAPPSAQDSAAEKDQPSLTLRTASSSLRQIASSPPATFKPSTPASSPNLS